MGQVIPKDRLTHDQSWRWSSGTSVNSRVQKERLQERRYGVCIQRLVNWAVVAQKKYPIKPILAPKINYKSAYQQGILHFTMVLKTSTQLPDNLIAVITLQLTSGSAP